MRNQRNKLLSTTVIPLVVFAGVAVGGVAITVQFAGGPAYAQCNPCNPCAAANPCNPCGGLQSLRGGGVQPMQSLCGSQPLRGGGVQSMQSLRGRGWVRRLEVRGAALAGGSGLQSLRGQGVQSL